jgi:hypothetical protein
MCDKGALKTAKGQFVKIVAWHSKKEGQVLKTFLLDCDDTDVTGEACCASTIKHSLDANDMVVSVLNGQMTESRGGRGTRKQFHKSLCALRLCEDMVACLVGYCTLHCLQLTISNAMITVLGKLGKNLETQFCCMALQLLHGACSLQKYHEPQEWIATWKSSAAQNREARSCTQMGPRPNIDVMVGSSWCVHYVHARPLGHAPSNLPRRDSVLQIKSSREPTCLCYLGPDANSPNQNWRRAD